MIAAWTTLDHTVNQIRLMLASGRRAARQMSIAKLDGEAILVTEWQESARYDGASQNTLHRSSVIQSETLFQEGMRRSRRRFERTACIEGVCK